MFMQVKSAIELGEADLQWRISVAKAQQAMCSDHYYATKAYKPAEVRKLWEVLESNMLFPLLVRSAPPVVLEAIVHLCKLFVTTKGLIASVPEALVGLHVFEVPCHMERVCAARLVTEAVVAVVPPTAVDEIELSDHMLTRPLNMLLASTAKQMFVHTVWS
ncbi:predicted protein [Pyrenophora tritici-repentis Pt-1C-BFP]|uniref:Uncharacterized protein n=1 Tax=Pyrenophora tritici-repentis (strain Pt-1C-BFP) TaxID=426418 RepID=B2WPI8_PYRTR|nr:uncharacterized protein PTRG_11939 [Pyrenophora tritici-repentis Pt-1C-BFP]EDU46054.1 predicted protein [Pyrenophora tritici-repentis Pt-1C-BFP]